MRIRKHQSRRNVGESSSGGHRPGPGIREQSELALSSIRVKENPDNHAEAQEGLDGPGARLHVPRVIERVDSTSRSAFTWLDKLRHSKGFTELEPYSNLEDFVSSLTKKDDGRGSIRSKEIVEGIDLSHLGGVDINVHQLVRYGSVCLESSSKYLNVHSLRPALGWYDVPDSRAHGNECFNAQLQGDASLPIAAERAEDKVDASGVPSQGAQILEPLLTKDDKQKGEGLRLHGKSSSYWGQARDTSWMRESLDASEVVRVCGESSGKKDFAGTSSRIPLDCEIADVSCQPTTGEAVFKQPHVGPGDSSASSKDMCPGGGSLSGMPFRRNLDTGALSMHVYVACSPRSYDLPAEMLRDAAQLNLMHDHKLFVPQGFMDQIAKCVGTNHGALPQIALFQDPPTEATRRRSSRNRRIPPSTVANGEPELRRTPPLSPDHPAQQMEDTLEFSLYTVLLRAGKEGLTAREAMSNIMKYHLAGVEEGAVQSNRRISKLLRSSPYYVEVEEGKFALCTAVIDSQQNFAGAASPIYEQKVYSLQGSRLGKERLSESSTANDSKLLASSEDKAAAVGMKRKRAVREALESEDVGGKPVRTGRPKKLKFMKQENAENLGNQCNRTDGKGWVCPLLAKPGYQLCDHHLDKLRCKPGSRSKKIQLKMAAVEAASMRGTTLGGHS